MPTAALGLLGVLSLTAAQACSAGGGDSSLWGEGQPVAAGTGGALTSTTSGESSSSSSSSSGKSSSSSSSSSGKSSSSSSGSAGGATWTQIYNDIFGPSGSAPCAINGSCHTGNQSGFACGTSKNSCYNGYVSSGWITPGAGASSSPLVDPTQSCLCGSLGGNMPKTYGSCITSAELNDIKTWLAAGAPNN